MAKIVNDYVYKKGNLKLNDGINLSDNLQVVGDNLVQILCTRLFFFIFYKKGLGFYICSLYND